MPETRAGTVPVPRFVPDTNVCLDLFVFDDPRCTSLMQAVRDGEVQLVTGEDCRAEWQKVLVYPRLGLSEAQRHSAEQHFNNHVRCLPAVELRSLSVTTLPRCRDPDDQMFLELALQSGAIALLTRDNALLQLARRTARAGLFAIVQPAAWQGTLTF